VETFGVIVEASHYEVGEKQHEIDFKYADGLTSADSAVTLKQVVKNIANLYRYHATFMPKPMFGMNGSGMHTHMSFADKKTGKNIFYDKKDPYGLSETAYYFMGGLLKYVREMSAIIAPTVNSYKRLTPGYEAPCYVCWARQNRSALVRVPMVRAGAEAATRMELRCPDPSANPYLAFAAMLKAGLQGIKDKVKAGKPVEEDVFEYSEADLVKKSIGQMPASLNEALREMDKSKLMRDLLGDHTFDRYMATKRAEWDSFRLAVTDWEIERYLEEV
jgi:glutamine synthetase